MSCEHPDRRAFLQSGCGLFTLAALGIAADVTLPVTAVAGAGSAKERSYAVPAADAVNIDRGAQVILVRYSGRIFAFSLVCPHEHAAVKWLNKDHRFQCSKHDSQYKQDGTYVTGHATRNLDRFPIRLENGMAVVSLDRVYQSDKHATAWAAATVAV